VFSVACFLVFFLLARPDLTGLFSPRLNVFFTKLPAQLFCSHPVLGKNEAGEVSLIFMFFVKQFGRAFLTVSGPHFQNVCDF